MNTDPSFRAIQIAHQILNGDEPATPTEASLDQLTQIYREVSQTTNRLLRVISFRDRLIASFPEFGNYRLFVTVSKGEKPRQVLSSIPRLEWLGPDGPGQSSMEFFASEIQGNWRFLLPIFCVSGV